MGKSIYKHKKERQFFLFCKSHALKSVQKGGSLKLPFDCQASSPCSILHSAKRSLFLKNYNLFLFHSHPTRKPHTWYSMWQWDNLLKFHSLPSLFPFVTVCEWLFLSLSLSIWAKNVPFFGESIYFPFFFIIQHCHPHAYGSIWKLYIIFLSLPHTPHFHLSFCFYMEGVKWEREWHLRMKKKNGTKKKNPSNPS